MRTFLNTVGAILLFLIVGTVMTPVMITLGRVSVTHLFIKKGNAAIIGESFSSRWLTQRDDIQPWADRFPTISKRFRAIDARHAIVKNRQREALAVAESIRTGSDPVLPDPETPWHTIERAIETGVNALLLKPEKVLPERDWIGYAEIVRGLYVQDPEKAQRALDTLNATYPDSHLATIFRGGVYSPPPQVVTTKRTAPTDTHENGPMSTQGQIPVPCWGVVKAHRTRAFQSDGSVAERVEAGSVAVIKSFKNSSIGNLASCDIQLDNRTLYSVFLKTADMNIIPEPIQRTPDRMKELQVEKAKLEWELLSVSKGKLGSLNMKNPHYDAYVEANEAYVDLWADVKALTKTRDTTSGAEHMRAADELHRMKGLDMEFQRTLAQAKSAYEQWERDNPQGPRETTSAAIREKLAMLETELDRL